jgi:hypothetical protein
MRRRRVIVSSIVFTLLVAVGVGITAYIRSRPHYPTGPDPNKADLRACFDFAGSADFNRMPEKRRYNYCDILLQRVARMPFLEILSMLTLEESTTKRFSKFQRNLRLLSTHKAIESHAAGTALEEFYKLPADARKGIVLAAVVALDQRVRWDPEFAPLPKPDAFMKQAEELLLINGDNPRQQALGMQFLMDVDSQRKSLGLKDPFYTGVVH